MNRFIICLSSVVVGLVVAVAAAEEPVEWTQWRGPLHNGLYPHETAWTANWPASGPKQLWRVEVGIGYSDIAVSQGRAYTVGNVEGHDVIYCLDGESGKTLWTERYPQELISVYNPGGPNATPVIDGPWLYMLSKQGLLSCLAKADGQRRWRIDLTKDANAKIPMWGFASAPLVIGDRLYLNANESGIAVDKNTGAILWNSKPDDCGYAAAVATSYRGEPALAMLGTRELLVVRQADGTILWRVDWPTKMGENSADPLAIDGKIYVSSWWDIGAALFDPAAGGTEPIWRSKALQNHISGAVLYEGHVYGSHGPVHRRTRDVAIRCLDATTGETKWSEPGLKGSLIVASGKLIILSHDGQLIIAEATPQGFRELARHGGLGTRTWAPPVLHQGRIYVRDADGWAICLDLAAK